METRFVSAGKPRAPFRAAWFVVLLLAMSRLAPAQVIETPVPFDTAGAVRSVTPSLATRLALTAPAWPVRDDFTEARLFSVSTGGYVLSVERRDGRRERHIMTADEGEALRTQVGVSLSRVGRVVGEDDETNISEPAGGAFVRNQMVLSAAMYAPALSALTHDATAGTTLYLLTIGGSFFALTDLSRRTSITKAQNRLSTDAALRATGLLFGTYFAAGSDEPSPDLAAATAVVGGIGGSILGYQLGRGLTLSEVKSMTFGSSLAALTGVGIGGTLGLFENSNERTVAAIGVAAGIAGYALGPAYPRRASYSVTAGDVNVLGITGLLGTMVAGIPLVQGDVGSQVPSAVLTAGMLAGVVIGDRVLVRRVDHTESDAGLVWLGTIAGGLVGAAVPVLAQSDNATAILSTVTAGALAGMWGAEVLVSPRRAGSAARRVGSRNSGGLRFDPGALALAAARRPGVYSVLNFKF